MPHSNPLDRLTLVLNNSFEACNITHARRAITMVLSGRAIVQEISSFSVRSGKLFIPIPSVVRLLIYRRPPRRTRSLSRKGVMLRDQNTCQYCRKVFPVKELTIDHVIPTSRGGVSSWENLVTACRPCNHRKGDHTPAEAGVPLLHRPSHIAPHHKYRLMAADKSWDKYLFT